MDENNAISVVENLIETYKDGQKGYQDAAQHVKRADLKTYFNQQSLERSRFAGELEAELVRLGKPDKKVPDQLRRRYIAPGSIPKSPSAAATRRSWNRWRKARTMPRTRTTRP